MVFNHYAASHCQCRYFCLWATIRQANENCYPYGYLWWTNYSGCIAWTNTTTQLFKQV